MFTVHCLVDNNTLDSARFRAEHGVSFAIETPAGQLLFDTGQSGDVLVHNAAQLGIDLSQIDALVLSHAHYDHTGGLQAFLQQSRTGLPLYAHPDLFRERYAIKDGQARSIGLRMAQTDLSAHAVLNLSVEPAQVLPGVWTTGEITARTEFEGRSAHHFIQSSSGWQPDPYRDDMGLVLEASSGLIVICGCCHAGLLNTLMHIQRKFDHKIIAIVGGTHLANLDEHTLKYAVTILRAINAWDIPYLFLNHCTGERALAVLSQAFDQKAKPCPAGTVLRFD
ncbi:MAG: MBL fold metallo-hydrolase [Anaerolineales bacterium]|jgi:7,8-dihydropterin-6-yl-methyl-4-(beta-D-ribofuranosyl)aminobenzene 5'-phosphate synthase|nr:MBL fold metallo-hydrolase [Anaerolineales bacterium]